VSVQRDAENAVLDYLQRVNGWDRESTTRFFSRGLAAGWFDGNDVEPELRALVAAYRTATRAGKCGANY
jgi:hypothetical protein